MLSSETLDIMRSRVTAPGTIDAVLNVPLEFGMGCEALRCAHSDAFVQANLMVWVVSW
jgi:hypothetical protein